MSEFPHDERERLALEDLLDQIKRGQCVLFLGAGVSREIGLPTGWELAAALARDLKTQPGALSQIAQDYQTKFNRDRLIQRVRLLIEQQPVVSRGVSSYDLLPEIEPLSRLIFTTNWDDQIEQAFRRKGIPATTVRYDAQAGVMGGHPHVVVKLHGDFGNKPDELILTRDDYVRAYKEVTKPGGLFTFLAEKLATATLLFVGYSLEDDDFRLLYDYVQEAVGTGERIHYAVMPSANATQKEYWRSRNITILDTTARELFEYVARQVREFVNRRQEIEYVTGPDAESYTEFYGFTGSGKTELLKKINDYYHLKEIWLQAYVNFEEMPNFAPLDLAEELSRQTLNYELGRAGLLERARNDPALAQAQESVTQEQVMARAEQLAADQLGQWWAARRVVLLFDTSEQIPAPIQHWIEYELAPALERNVGDLKAQVRLVLAGRKPVAWRSFRFKQHLHLRALSPFDETAIGEMLDWFAALKLREPFPRPKRQQIIRDILEITGGHPACIKHVLEDIAQRDFDVQADYVSERRKKLFNECVYPTLEAGVLTKVPEDLSAVLKVVCVFRRSLPDFLDVLVREGHLDKRHSDSMALLGRLRETHLILPPRPLYDMDVIAQHILALQLELHDPERYRTLHALALSIYEHAILGQTSAGEPLPKAPSAELQVVYIIEAIFHRLVLASLEHLLAQDVTSGIRSKWGEYQQALRSSIGTGGLPRVLEILAARLGDDPNQADHELLTLVEKLVPGDGYQTLLEPIMTLLEHVRGGDHHGI
jgi:hypothetical protein